MYSNNQNSIIIKIKWKVPNTWPQEAYRVEITAIIEKDIFNNYPSFSDWKLIFVQVPETTTTISTTTTSIIPTTSTVLTTSTIPTTTTISVCLGKTYQTCLFFTQCKWEGDPKLGRCVESKRVIYIFLI